VKRILVRAIALIVGVAGAATCGVAQSLEDLNVQIHGYATQGFVYTTQNNIFTMNTSNYGSPAWTEAVVGVSLQPTRGLRIGVQARYELLGNLYNQITLDWAQADYKLNDQVGIRVGKVKTPWGLFNEVQDIDPAYTWTLLPQSVYPLPSRNSYLTHYGPIIYGRSKLGHKLGKLEYDGWAGEGLYVKNDGVFLAENEAGYSLPNGIQGWLYGAALHWITPFPGLMVGASDLHTDRWSAPFTGQNGAINGTQTLAGMSQPNYFAMFEKKKFMLAYEYCRNWSNTINSPAIPAALTGRTDPREWYAMTTYKVTGKFTAGVYDSQIFDHDAPLGPARYQKDWAISGRYDINPFLYVKAEQHFIQGTNLGYDADLNPNLQPNTKLTALKVGVSF